MFTIKVWNGVKAGGRLESAECRHGIYKNGDESNTCQLGITHVDQCLDGQGFDVVAINYGVVQNTFSRQIIDKFKL